MTNNYFIIFCWLFALFAFACAGDPASTPGEESPSGKEDVSRTPFDLSMDITEGTELATCVVQDPTSDAKCTLTTEGSLLGLPSDMPSRGDGGFYHLLEKVRELGGGAGLISQAPDDAEFKVVAPCNYHHVFIRSGDRWVTRTLFNWNMTIPYGTTTKTGVDPSAEPASKTVRFQLADFREVPLQHFWVSQCGDASVNIVLGPGYEDEVVAQIEGGGCYVQYTERFEKEDNCDEARLLWNEANEPEPDDGCLPGTKSRCEMIDDAVFLEDSSECCLSDASDLECVPSSGSMCSNANGDYYTGEYCCLSDRYQCVAGQNFECNQSQNIWLGAGTCCVPADTDCVEAESKDACHTLLPGAYWTGELCCH